jgi:hypothetical protein
LEAYGIEPPDTETGDEPQEFTDADDIEDWALSFIDTLMEYGYDSRGTRRRRPTLDPMRTATQGEIIALIARMIGICY